jgi:hypothetical protein
LSSLHAWGVAPPGGIVVRLLSTTRLLQPSALVFLTHSHPPFTPLYLPRSCTPAHASTHSNPPSHAPTLQGVVKRFFNEKEVTSTLVMDALYCGCKLLEDAGRRCLQARQRQTRPWGQKGGRHVWRMSSGWLVG